jgi:hypothetical protein
VSAIVEIDPSRASTLADKIDLEGAQDLLSKLLPIIVKNKVTSQMAILRRWLHFIHLLNSRILNWEKCGRRIQLDYEF